MDVFIKMDDLRKFSFIFNSGRISERNASSVKKRKKCAEYDLLLSNLHPLSSSSKQPKYVIAFLSVKHSFFASSLIISGILAF